MASRFSSFYSTKKLPHHSNEIVNSLPQLSGSTYKTSDRSGSPKPGFRFLQVQSRNGFKASSTKIFFIFAKFLPYLMIFQSFASLSTLLYFEKSSNMPKIWQNMKKSPFNLPLNPFFDWFHAPENQISHFRYPIWH